MVDWILDSLRAVDEIDEVHLVTNHRFAPDFERWAMQNEGVTVHDDGTTSNEDRLGAMGDVAFTLERAGIDDDVLVVAGDNLFDFSLADFAAFWRSKGVASAVAVLDVGDLRLASQYGVVDVADDERIIVFVEKPADPPSTLAATATYIYHREHVPLVERYLAEGNAPDQVGQLHRLAARARAGLRVPVRRQVARHRRQGAAARRRQPAPPRAGSAGARRVPARDLVTPARFVHVLVTDRDVASKVCCSTSCCRPLCRLRAARGRALPRLSRRSDPLLRHRSAPAVARPAPGRCGAVWSAADGGWRSRAARAAIVYDARARRLVQAWKERGQRRLAREAAALVAETLTRPDVAALAFVPSDADRALERGHRPAEALADQLGRLWELPVQPLSGGRARSSGSEGWG